MGNSLIQANLQDLARVQGHLLELRALLISDASLKNPVVERRVAELVRSVLSNLEPYPAVRRQVQELLGLVGRDDATKPIPSMLISKTLENVDDQLRRSLIE